MIKHPVHCVCCRHMVKVLPLPSKCKKNVMFTLYAFAQILIYKPVEYLTNVSLSFVTFLYKNWWRCHFLYSTNKNTNKPYNIIKISAESVEGCLFLTILWALSLQNKDTNELLKPMHWHPCPLLPTSGTVYAMSFVIPSMALKALCNYYCISLYSVSFSSQIINHCQL